MDQLLYSAIPVDEFKVFSDKFFHASGFSSALISLDGVIVSSSGIHLENGNLNNNIVTLINSEEKENRLEYIRDFTQELVLRKKQDGLWDAASPLVIDDFHIGWVCLLNFSLSTDQNVQKRKGLKLLDMAAIHSVLDLLISSLRMMHRVMESNISEDHPLPLIDSNLVPLIIHQDNRIEYINGTAVELFGGKSLQNFIGKSIWNFIHPDFFEQNAEDSFDAEDTVIPKGDVKIIRLDGIFRDVEITSSKILFKGKQANQILLRDITRRKHTEKQLQRSELWNRALLNAVPDMMFKFSITGIVLDYLPPKVSSPNMPRKQVLGLSVYDIFTEDIAGKLVEYIKVCINSQGPQLFEYTENDARIYEGRMVVCGTDEVLLIIRDISDWKIAENQLKESIREKDMLLMELHHRVKNNLQIVSSLINQQARYIDDEVSIRAFMETKNRVHSMALIHEKMYQSRDFVHIDFPDYIKMMVHNLFQSYQLSSRIQPAFQTESLLVGIDIAIPCGLIINELVTNSLKYAFSDAEGGIITIGIKHLDDSMVEIMVSDNGRGLPETFSVDTMSSLGLTLVKVLTDQLDGELILEKEKGTTWRIRFSKS
ncbi:MAG: PAS domain S-box protein [Spirochaetales bacterium]|nr:PAS domain S-box protein [Spirochaetales bacterium]